jgi:surface polysaccharide O-acyltransferase-like enzyme
VNTKQVWRLRGLSLYPEKWDRVLSVDLIRAVAIVLVLLLHASTESYAQVELMSPQGVEIWWASNIYDSIARVCIPLFVMLAGALLLQPCKADEPLHKFYRKRWDRLGLPVIFWSIIYFAWAALVDGETLTLQSVVQGVLTGPYYQFWFLYLLIGLYLLTPILRVALKYASRHILKYTLVVWFMGTAIMPLLTLLGSYYLNANVFVFTGWLGYYILGAYLTKVEIKRQLLYAGLIGGLLWTIAGSYLVVATLGERFSQFFYDGFSVNIIVASASLFLLLLQVSPQRLQTKYPKGNHILSVMSANTLPIFFFHVIVLESLRQGFLGFTLNITSINPFFAIPLSTALTLLICLAVIVPLKRIPYVKRLIG